jgi:hypothetical protein
MEWDDEYCEVFVGIPRETDESHSKESDSSLFYHVAFALDCGVFDYRVWRMEGKRLLVHYFDFNH